MVEALIRLLSVQKRETLELLLRKAERRRQELPKDSADVLGVILGVSRQAS